MSYPKSSAGKPTTVKAKRGQVLTGGDVAADMVSKLFSERSPSREAARILDPCVGPFTFPKHMREQGVLQTDDVLTALDVDSRMIETSKRIEGDNRLLARCDFEVADYLTTTFEDEFDYAILNPPYIRQEWIEEKSNYRARLKERTGADVPGTSNLYVYFIVKTLLDLSEGGRFACVVYDSWQSTKYGEWLAYFLSCYSDFTTESAPRQPFDGRLIDATLIFGEKKRGKEGAATFLAGGDGASRGIANVAAGEEHSLFAGVDGFDKIDSLFSTRRGLRLKQSDFFLCGMDEVERVGATPFVKKVGQIDGYLVPSSHGEAALLTTSKERGLVPNPLLEELEERIEEAQERPKENESVLNWYREKPDSWFRHAAAPKAPIIFNYYLRNRPRHIHNPERAYSDNFYGVEVADESLVFAWLAVFNSTTVCAELFANARNQGNGLAKLQLYEYRRAYIPNVSECSPVTQRRLNDLGKALVKKEAGTSGTSIIAKIDDCLASAFPDNRLLPLRVQQLYASAAQSAKRPKTTY